MSDIAADWSYKPAKTLAWCVIGLLVLVTACELLATTIDVVATLLYPQTWNDPEAEFSGGEIILGLGLGLAAVGWLLCFIATVVLFCCWQYRVSANARALGAQAMEFTPGWNAGWWFVPFANLVKPFKAMVENYNASHPDAGESDWMQRDTPPIVGWWWGAWLFGNFLSQASFRLGMKDDPALVQMGTWVGVPASLLTVVTCVLIVRIILNITTWQAARAARDGQAAYDQACPRCASSMPAVDGAICPGCGLSVPA